MNHRTPRRLLLACATILSLSASFAHAWTHNPATSGMSVRTPAVAGDQNPTTVSDGAGGVIVVYNGAGNRIYAQRIDAAGNRLWGTDGIAVTTGAQASFYPVAAPDGAGGVYMAWTDGRNIVSTGFDLYMQRLNSAGVAQWTANGVALCTAAGDQITVRIAPEPGGGMLAAWEDGRVISAVDIYAQRVAANGVPQWTIGGVAVCTAAGNQTRPVLAPIVGVSSLSMFVAWQDARTDGGDIYLQVVNTTGAMTLAVGGVAVHNVTTNTQSAPEIVSDGGQLATIAWLDDRAGSGAADLYAQKVNIAGARLFAISGVAICSAVGACASHSVTSDGQGGVIAAWSDTRTGFNDIYARRLDSQGTARWTADGSLVCAAPGSQTEPVVLADAYGGCFVTWRDARAGMADLYGQRMNAAGTALWTADGAAICTAPYDQNDVALALGANNDLFVAWNDYRTLVSNTHLYVQRVDEWGMLGAEPVIRSVADVPNDQGGLVKLSWDASALDTDPAFRNIADYQVFRSAPPSAAASARARGALRSMADATGDETAGTFFVQRLAAAEYYWELLTTVGASHLSRYSVLAATSGDSVGGSNPRTGFLVMARTAGATQWWTSNADSGYSVDNLAPAAPAPLTGQYAAGETRLHWNPNHEADLAGYRLYRGSTAGFATDGAHFVSEVPDTGYTDTVGAPYFYKLVAVDSHGNTSPVATLAPTGTTDVEGAAIRVLAFSSPSPNPAPRALGARLSFTLPVAGHARLAVLDAAGRAVRTLADGTREAGAWDVRFDGRDDRGAALAPGLYFARLTTASGSLTRRIVLTD
ncbi:MAG: hypothetical protein IPJ04_09900 [Candidatus Eisenbacteria bacterium]|nr:hypothetical protein [Candidatus Eisenbacteria bacterium]